MEEARSAPKRLRPDAFAWSLLGLLALYTALAWTPSSYGVVFDQLGAARVGLVAGEPREIREDEYARWTSFVQAAVRNGFRRINQTSLYREDLLSPEGVPLADWGLALKPYFWAFFLVDPAHAFSFFHAFWIGAFLLGYQKLFRELGSPRGEAALASTTLFLTGFSQLWWTTYGPLLAGFPWMLVLCLVPLRAGVRFLATAYVAASWPLATLYPPIAVTLVFVAGVVVLAWRRDAYAPRRFTPFAAGALVGAGLALFYLREVFPAWAGTLYPGLRRSGGGGMPFAQWLSHALPSLVVDGERGLVNSNVCEAATVASFVPLLALCFVDGQVWVRGLRSNQNRPVALALATLFAGAALTSLWILAPVPQALGVPFLWHLVPPIRMWFACGLLIFLLGLGVLRHAPLRLSWLRAGALAGVVLGAHLVGQRMLGGSASWMAPCAALLGAVAAVVALRDRLGRAIPASLLACAALANAVAFGGFNPVQSAVPIFAPPATPGGAALDRLASRHPRGWVVLAESGGAWLNGLGYASAAHVLYAPQVERFGSLFPDLDEGRLEYLFNRALWVYPSSVLHPNLMNEASVQIPFEVFDAPSIRVTISGPLGEVSRVGGAIEKAIATTEGDLVLVHLSGWAPMDGADPGSSLIVHTALPVVGAVAYPALRVDIARVSRSPKLALSGFELRLSLLASSVSERPLHELIEEPICIVSESPGRPRFQLRIGGEPSCQHD